MGLPWFFCTISATLFFLLLFWFPSKVGWLFFLIWWQLWINFCELLLLPKLLLFLSLSLHSCIVWWFVDPVFLKPFLSLGKRGNFLFWCDTFTDCQTTLFPTFVIQNSEEGKGSTLQHPHQLEHHRRSLNGTNFSYFSFIPSVRFPCIGGQ